MNLSVIKNEIQLRPRQIILLDSSLKVIDSCNEIFDLSKFSEQPLSDVFDVFVGTEKTVLEQSTIDEPYYLPCVSLDVNGDGCYFDIHVIRKSIDEKIELVCVLEQMGTPYQILQESNQKMVEKAIENEVIKERERVKDLYYAQVERANKELERFAYIVSHDLKAPLRGVKNLAVWIREDMGDDLDEDIANYIRMMGEQTDKMVALIDAILKYSRAGSEKMDKKQVNTHALVQSILQEINVPDNFEVVVQPTLPTIFTHKLLLHQAFTNLIMNALIHHGGETGKIVIGAKETDELIEFSVSDNGQGIESDYHESIFEIFQQVHKEKGDLGSGIGLSIVKKLVNEMTGEIRVESVPGEGTTFYFTWPKV